MTHWVAVLAALPEPSLQSVGFALTERNHRVQHGSGRGVWYGLK